MTFAYLAALLFSITGLGLIDFRFRLALAIAPLRGFLVLAISVAFFLAWDVAGILLGIFFRGEATHLTGILLAPELPLEELFFLILLSYTALIVFTAIERRRERAKK